MATSRFAKSHTVVTGVAPSTYTPPNGAATTTIANGVPTTTWQSFNPPTPPPTPVFDPYLDPGYAGSANAQQNIDTHAQAEHDYQYGNIAQNTGYDSSGNLITDPSNPNFNPYAAAAVLKKHFGDTTRGTTNSYAAQGQLYAGSLLNAQDTNTYNYGLGSDQIQRGAANQYHGADTTLQGVLDTGQMTLAQLLGPAFQAFLAGQKGS